MIGFYDVMSGSIFYKSKLDNFSDFSRLKLVNISNSQNLLTLLYVYISQSIIALCFHGNRFKVRNQRLAMSGMDQKTSDAL